MILDDLCTVYEQLSHEEKRFLSSTITSRDKGKRLLFLFQFEQPFQVVETVIPTGRAVRNPLLCMLETGGSQADHVDSAFALSLDQLRLLQHAQMPGDGRQGDAKWFGELGHGLVASLRELP